MRGEKAEKEGEEAVVTQNPSPTAAFSKLAVPNLDGAGTRMRPADLST